MQTKTRFIFVTIAHACQSVIHSKNASLRACTSYKTECRASDVAYSLATVPSLIQTRPPKKPIKRTVRLLLWLKALLLSRGPMLLFHLPDEISIQKSLHLYETYLTKLINLNFLVVAKILPATALMNKSTVCHLHETQPMLLNFPTRITTPSFPIQPLIDTFVTKSWLRGTKHCCQHSFSDN